MILRAPCEIISAWFKVSYSAVFHKHVAPHSVAYVQKETSTRAVLALSQTVKNGGWGRFFQEKLGRDARPPSQNPYPIYDQNLRFSLPYLWPDLTWQKIKRDRGRQSTDGKRRDEEVASSNKKKTKLKTRVQKSIPYLWPKLLKNHTLWGHTYLYSPYKGVPPPPGFGAAFEMSKL